MGNKVMQSDLTMTEPLALAALDDSGEYDFAHIGMESAFPALQARHWHEPTPHAVHTQGAL